MTTFLEIELTDVSDVVEHSIADETDLHNMQTPDIQDNVLYAKVNKHGKIEHGFIPFIFC